MYVEQTMYVQVIDGCFPSRPNTSWSLDTFVNGRGVHRQSDTWGEHC